ncbi:MAG: (2Fe-2S)-binding protein [Candidatus Binatia bacterium]|nr:(2Fe-2S)-binding protein [Candidatus Binatia bacterium]
MVVCLCQGVSEKQVREAIVNGATSRKKVTSACGAGAGCGGCHGSIRDIIREHRAAEARAAEARAAQAKAGVEPACATREPRTTDPTGFCSPVAALG